MSQHGTDEDVKVLHEMGYAQELSRRMGGFQSFAISFSIICIISGGLASFPIALSTVGPWMATIGWILAGCSPCLSPRALAKLLPLTRQRKPLSLVIDLGGRFWGWLTAYINLLGLMFVIPAVNIILYGFIRDLLFSGMLGWDVSTWTNFYDPLNTNFTFGFIVVAGNTIAQCLLNHVGIKLTTIITDFSGYLIFAITILLIGLLFVHIPKFDFGQAFALVNKTGETGGNVASQYGLFIAVLMGMLYPLFTITGFDASAHTSEETVNAPRHRSQGHAAFGVLVNPVWLRDGDCDGHGPAGGLHRACRRPEPDRAVKGNDGHARCNPGGPAPADMAVLGYNSFLVLFNTLIMPSALGKVAASGIIIANFCCALAAVTSTSRMIYAFARDGGMPRTLASVSPGLRTPVAAIWFTGLITFVLVVVTAPLNAFAALSTGCAMYLYMSYAMPIVAGLFAEGKSWTTFGNFRLGGFSKPAAVIVALGTIGVIIAAMLSCRRFQQLRPMRRRTRHGRVELRAGPVVLHGRLYRHPSHRVVRL